MRPTSGMLSAHQPARIAPAVPPLVVAPAAGDQAVHERHRLEDALALRGVRAKHRDLFGRQLAGLVEHVVAHADLADVVHDAGLHDRADLRLAQREAARDDLASTRRRARSGRACRGRSPRARARSRRRVCWKFSSSDMLARVQILVGVDQVLVEPRVLDRARRRGCRARTSILRWPSSNFLPRVNQNTFSMPMMRPFTLSGIEQKLTRRRSSRGGAAKNRTTRLPCTSSGRSSRNCSAAPRPGSARARCDVAARRAATTLRMRSSKRPSRCGSSSSSLATSALTSSSAARSTTSRTVSIDSDVAIASLTL